jgi:N-methylhydantoinase B
MYFGPLSMSPIELSILVSRVEAVCGEMGAVLQKAAFSPNIKDRLDFSCALFDAKGGLYAQAAHIPVHLGSMAYAMADIVAGVDWRAGDVLVINDPFLGGTHLPDVTMVAPLFCEGLLVSFVANRAHHANIGSDTPGSMPVSSRIEEEGIVIPPTLIYRAGEQVENLEPGLAALMVGPSRGDFSAQLSSVRVGLVRLEALVRGFENRESEVENIADTRKEFAAAIDAINEYGARMAQAMVREIPNGVYTFSDVMDGDGFAAVDVPIKVKLTVEESIIDVDFTGTSPQVEGNINCPISVAAAGVFYVFRCLLPMEVPSCAGTFSAVRISAPKGSLVNAERPAATAAGNVETSMRIVDVVLGALASALPDKIPAASQGTMNNVAMGNHQSSQPWDYYETIGGGLGASIDQPGLSAVQAHMTNTLNTPIESLESHYPLRITTYAVRRNSGGQGQHRGGDGLVREFEFLEAADVTLLTERRQHRPWGLHGGGEGSAGINTLDGEHLPSKVQIKVTAGQRLKIETPGGGAVGQKKL